MFLFSHITTDMVKTFSGDEFRTSASSNDVLNPATAYTLYIYQQNQVVYTHNFTTSTFATASTRTPSTIEGLNGGLLSSSSSAAPLVIEYKTNEFLFFPYIYPSANRAQAGFDATVGRIIQCSTPNLTCNSGYNYSTGFAKSLSPNIIFVGALQPPNATGVIYRVNNASDMYQYNTKLITE